MPPCHPTGTVGTAALDGGPLRLVHATRLAAAARNWPRRLSWATWRPAVATEIQEHLAERTVVSVTRLCSQTQRDLVSDDDAVAAAEFVRGSGPGHEGISGGKGKCVGLVLRRWPARGRGLLPSSHQPTTMTRRRARDAAEDPGPGPRFEGRGGPAGSRQTISGPALAPGRLGSRTAAGPWSVPMPSGPGRSSGCTN